VVRRETSIYFALNPHKPFPRAFPLYFWVLGRLFSAAGVSVYSARLFSALAGIATLWLAWRCIRRFAGDEVALPALVLLVLSPGHLFWSQSIRYYMLLMVFQIASIHAFLTALERRSLRWSLLTVGWLVLALLTNTGGCCTCLRPGDRWSGQRRIARQPWVAIGTRTWARHRRLTTLLTLHDQFSPPVATVVSSALHQYPACQRWPDARRLAFTRHRRVRSSCCSRSFPSWSSCSCGRPGSGASPGITA
jgi:hypothetical protein